VQGEVEAVVEVGDSARDSAMVAATGAIEAAGFIGNTAERAVTDILVGAVVGIRKMLSVTPLAESEGPGEK
jgi:hypothetical protein